jgi:hypothetical protein
MGESKLPKAPPREPDRPVMAILRLSGTIQVLRATPASQVDAETRQYMGDLGAVLDWLAHLERRVQELTPPPKPN